MDLTQIAQFCFSLFKMASYMVLVISKNWSLSYSHRAQKLPGVLELRTGHVCPLCRQ